MKSAKALIVACAIVAYGGVQSADAGIIAIGGDTANSTEGIGNFSGTLEYNSIDATSGMLIVTLTNTSPAANGGYITGFVFNIDSVDAGASATLQAAPAPTHPFQNTGPESGVPFGNPYDAGAALGGNFLGGGSPVTGIAVGDTGIFHMLVSASDAGSLDAIDFVNGPFEFDFIVRFRGFEDGGSDKVPVTIIPLPSGMLLGMAGLAGIGLTRRRRRG